MLRKMEPNRPVLQEVCETCRRINNQCPNLHCRYAIIYDPGVSIEEKLALLAEFYEGIGEEFKCPLVIPRYIYRQLPRKFRYLFHQQQAA